MTNFAPVNWVRLTVRVLLFCLAVSSGAQAHESRPAYLELTETAPGQYTVLWRTPMLAGQRLPLALSLPEGVSDLREPVVQELSDSLVEHRWIDAGPGGLGGERIEIKGLQFTITDVLARVQLQDGRSWTIIARPAEPWVEITAALSAWQVAIQYVIQGIRHILFGPDHLLFVFGLLLIVRNGWSLVKTITAFTVAHSITLAAATLGYVSVPVPPVEAAIALSILFLGPEIVRQWRGGTSITIRNPWVVAFAFGLLHGFGFASVLDHTGLPPADLPLALLFFNVGVELGQLAFVAVIVLLERAISRLRFHWPIWVKLAPGYAVGIMGAFWTFQRAALVFG
jgi:hydrogenase/urease accessory protein HupE